MKPILAVVIPVHNERTALPGLFIEWEAAFKAAAISPLLIFVDDFSDDGSSEILKDFAASRGDAAVRIVTNQDSSSRGHGFACVLGYRAAIGSGARWVLQIDSDGQCDSTTFQEVWNLRAEDRAVFGCRTSRLDGLKRRVASKLVKAVCSVVIGREIPDPNSPFRLMPAKLLQQHLEKIPNDFELKNVALTVLLTCAAKPICIATTFRLRTHSKPEKPLRFFAGKGLALARDLYRMRATAQLVARQSFR